MRLGPGNKTEASASRKRAVLAACILSSSLVGMDGMMTTVALPAIAEDLGGGLAVQQWVVAGFLLALGSLLLAGGALGDVYDRWCVFGVGTAAFGAATLLSALAPSATFLIAGRLLQGAAAALMIPSALAVIITTFSGPARPRAIGSWTAWSGLSVIAGPALGGLLIEAWSWRAVYGALVPLAAIVVFLIYRAAPTRIPRRAGGQPDWGGVLLGVPAVGGPAVALIQGPNAGWSDPLVLLAIVIGVLASVAFIWWERRAPNAMLALHLFNKHNFVVLNIVTFVLYGALISSGVYTVLFLNQTAGYSATAAGLAAAVPIIVLFFLSKPFGVLADRYPPRLFVGGGSLVAALGILLLLRADADADFLSVVLPSVLLHGVGLAMVVSPLTAAVLAAAGDDHASIASGINNAVARLGSLFAVAVVGALVSAQFSASLDQTLKGRDLGQTAAQALEQAREQPLTTSVRGAVAPEDATVLADSFTEASVVAFRLGVGAIGTLALLAGALGVASIRGRQRTFQAARCPGGSLAGAHRDLT